LSPIFVRSFTADFGEDETSLWAADFLEKQWEVVIPIMHKNMIFPKAGHKSALAISKENNIPQKLR
jgi:hypothetical protein